jgi:hypothetical protein
LIPLRGDQTALLAGIDGAGLRKMNPPIAERALERNNT